MGRIPDCVPGAAVAQERAWAQRRAGLHHWVGKKRGTQVQALGAGGVGRRLLSGRSPFWERVPNVVAATWGLGLRRAGNLATRCSSAPISESISFPAASSAVALPVLIQPTSAPCTKLSVASPVQTPNAVSSMISFWFSLTTQWSISKCYPCSTIGGPTVQLLV